MDKSSLENMWAIIRENNFDASHDISSDLRCTICMKILIDACDAPCGCLFCKSCINRYLNGDQKKCPGLSEYCDNKLLDINRDINTNRAINIKISKLSINCPNIDCYSMLELKMMEDHLRICENQIQSCPYVELGCEKERLGKDQMNDHLVNEIHSHAKLMINWTSNCRNEMDSLKREMEKLRTEMEENKETARIDKERTEEIIQDLQKRDQENSSQIKRLNDSNRLMKEELKKVKISPSNMQLQNHEKAINQLQIRLQQAESRSNEIHQKSVEIDNMQMKIDEISQVCQAMKFESPTERKSIPTNPDTIYGEINWKIDNWFQKAENALNGKATEIFSDPFLTEKEGYKICLSVWNNRCYNKGSLPIAFHIMKGPFDDFLKWPFDRVVEFSLMNHDSGLPYKSDILSCYNSKIIGYQKPIHDRNFANGFPQFISMKILSTVPGLVKNNQTWIKFTVKPSN